MNVKKEFHYFSLLDYEQEQEYLRKMHKNGWKCIRITVPGIYTFEPCTPEDVIYQLDYNEEGLKHKEEYIKMFEDCGWEYVREFNKYCYFRKPANQGIDDSIFCDDQSRLDMMNRIFKGQMIPLLIIFFLLLVPSFYHVIVQGDYSLPFIIIYIILMALYLWVFITFAIKYHKFKKDHVL